jgi:hypothetical protein
MPEEPRHKPEEKYLRRKLDELTEIESILAQREAELSALRGGLLAFEQKYESVVGAKFAELDEIRVRIAELSTGLSPPVDSSAREDAPHGGVAKTQATGGGGSASRGKRRARRKDTNARSATPPPASAPAKPPAELVPAKTLRQLYRDIAKALHPDLGEDDASRAHRHEYMTRANVAYEAGDEATLRAVLAEWDHAPESVGGQGAGAELVRVIRRIDRAELRLATIAREIEQLQNSGLFGLKTMTEEAGQFERDLLAEMTGRLDGEIAAAKQMLARMESQALPSQLPQLPPQTPAEPGG